MRAYLFTAAAVALCWAACAPASAEIVTVRAQGTIPGGGVQGAGSGPFTPFQESFFGGFVNFGNSYDFTFRYDTASSASGGVFPLQLLSGQVGGLTNFSDFTPYIQFQPAGAYTYMSLFLRKTETFGPNTYLSYVALSFGDNDGTVQSGVLPTTIVPADYDIVNISFETYGRDGSYRSLPVGTAQGVSQVLSGVPEPATWAMMIAGFGAIGGVMRRRAAPRVRYA